MALHSISSASTASPGQHFRPRLRRIFHPNQQSRFSTGLRFRNTRIRSTRPPMSRTPSNACFHCRKPGHVIADCRKRKYENIMRDNPRYGRYGRPQHHFSKMPRNGMNEMNEIGIGTALQMSILSHTDIGSTRTKRSVHALSVDWVEDRKPLGLDLLFSKI
jgi:hypothetical protein